MCVCVCVCVWWPYQLIVVWLCVHSCEATGDRVTACRSRGAACDNVRLSAFPRGLCVGMLFYHSRPNACRTSPIVISGIHKATMLHVPTEETKGEGDAESSPTLPTLRMDHCWDSFIYVRVALHWPALVGHCARFDTSPRGPSCRCARSGGCPGVLRDAAWMLSLHHRCVRGVPRPSGGALREHPGHRSRRNRPRQVRPPCGMGSRGQRVLCPCGCCRVRGVGAAAGTATLCAACRDACRNVAIMARFLSHTVVRVGSPTATPWTAC